MTEKRRRPQAFKPGQSGNPRGKPPGTRNKATNAVLALLEGEADAITRVCIDAAKGGDMTAIRLILERLAPPARERPLSIALPDVSTLAGISDAQAAIVQAAAGGELLPGEAATLSGILEARRKSLETQELEQRIAALEEAGNAKA
jgi:hypothetical protein